MQGLQRSSSVDLLLETDNVGEPSGCPETSPHVMTGVHLPSEEGPTRTPKTDKVGSSSEEVKRYFMYIAYSNIVVNIHT